jgi:TDG/mug DNA glycosylase family protein
MHSLYWSCPLLEKSKIQAKNANTDADVLDSASVGFAPIAREDARILILGSLPGQRSLQEVEYYAHPRNAFWPIMNDLFSIDGDYTKRCADLVANGIALWDVLAQSVRPGSLDADIQLGSSKVNDFKQFFDEHQSIEIVCFNGRKAGELFGRFADQERFASKLRFETLPSTSPAYASMAFDQKRSIWRNVIC